MKNRFSMFVVSPTGHMTELNLTEYNSYVRGSTDEQLAANQVFTNEDQANEAIDIILARREINGLLDGLDIEELRVIKKVVGDVLDGNHQLDAGDEPPKIPSTRGGLIHSGTFAESI